MPLFKTKGIVLKKQEYGECDEIISLLSPDYGKIKVIVKGVRKVKGSQVGKFELFSEVSLLLARGRNIEKCMQAQLLAPHSGLREDLVRLSYGLYYLELFDRFLPFSEPHPSLYRLIKKALHLLEEELEPELLSVLLLYHFLKALGYEPSLTHCAECGDSEVLRRFSPSQGGLCCGNCLGSSRGSLAVDEEVLTLLRVLPGTSLKRLRSLGGGRTGQGEQGAFWKATPSGIFQGS
ncbi:MAG: DNA repair protein RecO [Candidatus Eremiobacteraeota bacterium]|nr:DNA repair protein RecO [Candidatus Eremiobacteraeota bacterium]